jgi:hypothetical protein
VFFFFLLTFFFHGVCCFWVLRLPRNPALTNHAADLLSPVLVLWIRTLVFVNHIIIPTLENKIRARGWRFEVEKNQQRGNERRPTKKKKKRKEAKRGNLKHSTREKKKKKRGIFSGIQKERKKKARPQTIANRLIFKNDSHQRNSSKVNFLKIVTGSLALCDF